MKEIPKPSAALSVMAGLLAIYALTAGFVLAPIENHMRPEALQTAEKAYSPLIYFYENFSIYRKLIDWQDCIADGW